MALRPVARRAELGWSDDADGIGVGIGRVQLAVGHRF